ncbi:MAG: molybdopterin-dependent oxidoreductase, partial [Methylohalobius sp.]|nr:molybdopterin-dependent oxidoreductase [Methylohalobius sp.]
MKLIKRQPGIDRRTFLYRSAWAVGGALVANIPLKLMRKAQAQEHASKEDYRQVRTICTHCSVGCGIIAEVKNGVWIGQEPAFDHPFNLGAHCAKGASVREHGLGEKRLKYPLKQVAGKWRRISWDQAIDEIGAKLLKIRQESGPDAVYWLGSSKHSNEQAYLLRKFVSFWGTNNCDHQARICHSTTVAGVAATFGYGAMTNSFNDIRNSRAILIIGGNPAEAHPISMQHILRAKEKGARLIVVDPRFTRTAAHADQYVCIRPGADVPLVYGILWHIFKHGWEDKDFIRQRVYGLEAIRQEAENWSPAVVEETTGVKAEEVYQIAKTLAENRPGTVVWCMGITQHHHGSSQTRLLSILQLALGNMGVAGGGTNIFRGHDNVQGA